MAKNGNGKRTIFYIIGVIVSLASFSFIVVRAYTAGVKNYVTDHTELKAEVKHQEETHTAAVETIKAEGCLPARQSKTDIAVLKEGQKTILGKLDELLEK